MSFRANLSLARRLARTGRNRDGVFWLLFTVVGQQIRLQVKLCRHKIVIRTGSPDLPVALSCLQGEFDELLNAVPTLRHPFIVDAGGYIGTAAIVFAEAYPDATVVSLEPSAENFALLQRTSLLTRTFFQSKRHWRPRPEG